MAVQKVQEKILKHLNYKSEWDKAPKSIYNDLIQEHEQLAKVQIELECKRAGLQKTYDMMSMKCDDIEKKKMDLIEVFKSSAKTIVANKASILHIADKVNEHKKQQESLEIQINDLKFQRDNMVNIMTEMEDYVRKYTMYEEFLEKVVTLGSDFNSVGDILNRYECLENVRRELEKITKESLDDIIKARSDMVIITEERSNLLRDLDNKLINMHVKIKQVKESSKRWEIVVQGLKLMIIKKIEEKEKFKAGCWDLYISVLRQREQINNSQSVHHEFYSKDHSITKNHLEQLLDTEGQLNYIQKSIEFYKEVLRLASMKYTDYE